MWAATQHKSALLLDDTVIITQPHAYTEESLITMTRIRKINSSMQLWLTQSISWPSLHLASPCHRPPNASVRPPYVLLIQIFKARPLHPNPQDGYVYLASVCGAGSKKSVCLSILSFLSYWQAAAEHHQATSTLPSQHLWARKSQSEHHQPISTLPSQHFGQEVTVMANGCLPC